jgi:hypothetical protein
MMAAVQQCRAIPSSIAARFLRLHCSVRNDAACGRSGSGGADERYSRAVNSWGCFRISRWSMLAATIKESP